MSDVSLLEGKKILIVDDEPDILAVLEDLLDMCELVKAFTPDNLVKSIKEGAASYIPKEEITEIAEYLVDVLTAKKEGRNPWDTWQEKLPTSYFERRWGAAWKDNDRDFWDTFKASLKSRKK